MSYFYPRKLFFSVFFILISVWGKPQDATAVGLGDPVLQRSLVEDAIFVTLDEVVPLSTDVEALINLKYLLLFP